MKKPIVVTLLLLLPMLLFAMSSKLDIREDLFQSDKELENFQASPLEDTREEAYYDKMKIYLLTGGPGSAIWENFGHAAMVVIPDGQNGICFDYGIFTFDESFYGNFVLGKLYYEVMETYPEYRIWALEDDDRTVDLLELELSPEEKKAMVEFLLYNTEPENTTYLYDYFGDNCATRLRDIYSWATGGDFEAYLKAIPAPETTRETVHRYMSRSTFLPVWTINYLLGPSTDKKGTMWEACFLPDYLQAMTEDYQRSERNTLYQTTGRKPVPESWSLNLRSFVLGSVLVCLALLAEKRVKVLGKLSDLLLGFFHLFLFILSSVLLFMMFFTIHRVTHYNMNILYFSPLSLGLAVLHFLSLGRRRRETKMARLSALCLLFSLSGTIVRILFSSVLIQDSWAVTIVSLMLYAAEALPLLKKNRS